jgi:hypothetical protein
MAPRCRESRGEFGRNSIHGRSYLGDADQVDRRVRREEIERPPGGCQRVFRPVGPDQNL